jgi:replicative DNA helicase
MRTLEQIFKLYRDAVPFEDAGAGLALDYVTADGTEHAERDGADERTFQRADLSQWVEDWGKVERVDLSSAVCGAERLAAVWRICCEELTRNVFVDGKAPAVFWIDWIKQRHFRDIGDGMLEISDEDAEAVNALADDLETISSDLLEEKAEAVFFTILENAAFLKRFNLTRETLTARGKKRREEAANRNAAKKLEILLDGVSEKLSQELPEESISEILATASKKIENINRERLRFSTPPPRSWAEIERAIIDEPPALFTGFDAFPPLVPGAVTLISGRPGQGKTTLMLNILRSLAEADRCKGKSLLFFTYEESEERLYRKLLCSLIREDLSERADPADGVTLGGSPSADAAFSGSFDFIRHYLRNDPINWKTEQARDLVAGIIEDNKAKLAEMVDSGRLRIVSSPPSVENFKAKLHTLKEEAEIGAVFVDYVQRMWSDSEKSTTRETINAASRALVASAVEFGAPVIVGSQYNREASKQNREAGLHDLKESGNLEEDANTVIGVTNLSRDIKNRKEELGEKSEDPKSLAGRNEFLKVKTLKIRDGQPKTGFLRFSNRAWRIDDFDVESESDRDLKATFQIVRDEYIEMRKTKKQGT